MRKGKSKIADLDLTANVTRKLHCNVRFTQAQIIEALRDYLHKHNREVPPSNARLISWHHILLETDMPCAELSWTEDVVKQ